MSQFDQFPAPAPKRSKLDELRSKRWFVPAAAAAVLVVGIGIGASSASDSTHAAAAPAPTVTATPEPAPTVTVTAEPVETKVPVKYTPVECVRYIELSERIFGYAGEAMGAATTFDAAGVDEQTQNIKKITAETNAAKAACRASAE